MLLFQLNRFYADTLLLEITQTIQIHVHCIRHAKNTRSYWVLDKNVSKTGTNTFKSSISFISVSMYRTHNYEEWTVIPYRIL